jgi:hypothetical protein
MLPIKIFMVVEKIPISERLEYKNNVHIRIGEK